MTSRHGSELAKSAHFLHTGSVDKLVAVSRDFSSPYTHVLFAPASICIVFTPTLHS